jgi:hypothetical protein
MDNFLCKKFLISNIVDKDAWGYNKNLISKSYNFKTPMPASRSNAAKLRPAAASFSSSGEVSNNGQAVHASDVPGPAHGPAAVHPSLLSGEHIVIRGFKTKLCHDLLQFSLGNDRHALTRSE